MDYRIGICSSCRVNYKIPATFTPNQARCRSCSGVVEIGPAHTGEEQRSPPRALGRAEPRTSAAREPRARPQRGDEIARAALQEPRAVRDETSAPDAPIAAILAQAPHGPHAHDSSAREEGARMHAPQTTARTSAPARPNRAQPAAIEPKRKSWLVAALIAIVVVLVVVGGAWTMFARDRDAQTGAAQPAHAAKTGKDANTESGTTGR